MTAVILVLSFMSLDQSPSSNNGIRVVLVSCGAFSPPTYAHLRMFERARDYLERTLGYHVVEGIMSPFNDFHSQTNQPAAKHRLRMVEAAVRKNYWIYAGHWECSQQTKVKPISVLKYYQKKFIHKYGGDIRIMYLCGSNVLDDFAKVTDDSYCMWNQMEIRDLLKQHGLVVVQRGNNRPAHTIYLMDVLRKNQKNIYLIEDETFPNDLRSARVRTALHRGESVKYCLDDDVIEYIEEYYLYQVKMSDSKKSLLDASTKSIQGSEIPGNRLVSGESLTSLPPGPLQQTSSEGKTMHVMNMQSVQDVSMNRIPLYSKDVSAMSSYATQENSRTLCNKETTCMKTVTLRENTPEEGISEEETLKGIPVQLPKTAFMKPILSMPTPIADSPLLFPSPPPTRCERQETMGSPNYDNVTLDELLVASTSWAEYMSKQCENLNEQRPFEKKSILPNDSPPSREFKERKSWFFARNRSLKEIRSLPSECESTIEICGTEKGGLPQPEILWRKEIKSKEKEKPFDQTISPKKVCARHPQTAKGVDKSDKRRKECKSLRFAHVHTRSTENIHRVIENGSSNRMTQSYCDGVTLKFRRYHLTATPETTV